MAFLRLLGIIVLAGCALVAAAVSAFAQAAPEADVKAAFLYNFTRFVTWPSGAPVNGEPFRLCVAADETMVRAIQKTMAGESVSGRPVEVVLPRAAEDAKRCHLLFVGRGDDRTEALLAAVRDHPVLTVGDGASFLRQGGGIQFLVEDSRMRFNVNLTNIEKTGLAVSSRLLRVARRVDGGRRPGP